MSGNKGYSTFRRKGETKYTCVVADAGNGKPVSMRLRSRAVLNAWGAKMVADAERMRAGLVNPAEVATAKAAALPINEHINAFVKDMKAKGVTAGHIAQTKSRVRRVFGLALISSLNAINSERIQTSLKAIADDSSPQTARGYWVATKSFLRFCERTDRLLANPAKGVRPPKAAGEVFSRRPFSHEDVRALLLATEARAPKHRSDEPPGRDRAMYYQTMAVTGFRRGVTATLTPESFDLLNGTVTAEAPSQKARREHVVPLRADYVALYAAYLADKPAEERIWPFKKHFNLTKMFKRDCAAADLVAREGEVMGMHSLRRYFGTNAAHEDFAAAVILMDHKHPSTTRKYLDARMANMRRVIDSLPASPLAQPKQERKAQ